MLAKLAAAWFFSLTLMLVTAASWLFIPQGGWNTPADKTTLRLWKDVSQETGLSDNDPMSTLTEFSGSGYPNCTATTTTRPLYKTNITNGKPAALFDGTDDFFTCASNVPTNLQTNQAMCFMLVARYNDKGAGNQFGIPLTFKTNTVATSGLINKQFALSFVENQAGTWGNLWFYFSDTTSVAGVRNDDTWQDAWHLLMISYSGSNPNTVGSFTLWQDGVSLTLATGSSTSSAQNQSYFGKWDSGTIPMKGYIGEFAYWDAACSGTDASNAKAYATAKWGTP